MKWAYPSLPDLTRQMIAAHDACRDGSVKTKLANARREIRRYAKPQIAAILSERLRAIGDHADCARQNIRLLPDRFRERHLIPKSNRNFLIWHKPRARSVDQIDAQRL